MRAALLWTEKEIEVDLSCLEADHPEYRQELAALAQMKIALETTVPIDASIAREFGLYYSSTYETSGEECSE